nr:bifunctional diguanylate cyclase/phosphodiesterase [Oleiagrimonas sp. C23AA]
MVHHYNLALVAVSVTIAIVNSYVSFSVIGRILHSRGWQASAWVTLGAMAMGFGVWSMHFVGMLAFDIGTPLGYSTGLTLLSVVPAILAAGIVCRQMASPKITTASLALAGTVMGAGVGAMHYTGMAAMRMSPSIVWDWAIVVLSVLFAVAGSIASLAVGVRVGLERRRSRRVAWRIAASVVMGCTVSGMHYLGMAAAGLRQGALCLTAHDLVHGRWLAMVVTVVALGVLVSTALMALAHQRVQRHSRRMDVELEQARSALHFQAFHDTLTGLPNRAMMMEKLRDALQRQEHSPVAVMFIDLDGFKTINDSLGHEAGDMFLCSVAAALRNSVRERDTVARFGGDEFVIALERFGGMDNLVRICRKILDLVSRPVVMDGHPMTVSPSIGVALAPRDGNDAETLLRNADAAMYAVKETGKADFRFFERGMHEMARERLTLTMDLRDALMREQIRVVYQPKWSLSSGQVVGVEALARWHHNERGEVPPLVFVPVAERSGMISMLGEQVLKQVLRQVERWDDEGLHVDYVTINLSLQELRAPAFADRLCRLVQEHEVDPARIRFEITESTAMRDPEQMLDQLRDLRDRGFSLLVDDFGTGYSSLQYLRQMPVSTIKIDQSFVRGSQQNFADREITEAIVALAKKLHLETVAEGVETQAQVNWLRDLGCDVAQGFFFNPPMAPEALGEVLRRGACALS